MSWFIDNDYGNALFRVILFVLPILMIVPGLIWWERRLLSWMQDRIGPNRVGNITFSKTSRMVPGFLKGRKFRLFGLLQPIADGVKLFFKEDITPADVDRFIYFLAPAVALFPAFALGGVMPFAPWPKVTPVADVEIGVLFIMAVSSLGVYGVVLAGYASNNKYSLMGGLRASAQLISYELAMGMSLAGVVLATGSLKITEMIALQAAPLFSGPELVNGVVQQVGGLPWIQNWLIFTPFGLIAGIIFMICMVAETNRAPFDLPEAENELIAGYHTEYSSMKFAVFFMGEYAAMFIFSGIFTAIFLGGWHPLPIRFEAFGMGEAYNNFVYWTAPFWFMGKMATVFSLYIWIRATLPRLRYDQLMNLGWRSLLPLAVANFIIVGLWIMVSRVYGWAYGLGALLGALILLWLFYVSLRKVITKGQPSFEHRTVTMVDPSLKSLPGGN